MPECCVSPFSVDLDKNIISGLGQHHKVEPQVAELMTVLLNAAPSPVSLDDIILGVWGAGQEPASVLRAIYVYVWRLRTLLEGSGYSITTIYNKRYQFIKEGSCDCCAPAESLALDAERNLLFIEGTGKKLSSSEMHVFSKLLRAYPRHVSVPSLSQHLWDDQPPRHPDKNIRQYIYQLRRTLKESAWSVANIWGDGYCLQRR